MATLQERRIRAAVSQSGFSRRSFARHSGGRSVASMTSRKSGPNDSQVIIEKQLGSRRVSTNRLAERFSERRIFDEEETEDFDGIEEAVYGVSSSSLPSGFIRVAGLLQESEQSVSSKDLNVAEPPNCNSRSFSQSRLPGRQESVAPSSVCSVESLQPEFGSRMALDERFMGKNTYRLKTYKPSFTAKVLVDWLIDEGACRSFAQAGVIGQELLEAGIFKHAWLGSEFKKFNPASRIDIFVPLTRSS